jgi:Dyp-type peroxidase family
VSAGAELTGAQRADIQGDILRAYGNNYKRTSYLFAHVDEAAAGRAWLAGLLAQVTNYEEWPGAKPDVRLNVALTYTGLQALGLTAAALETFSVEFREGMAARAQGLGDIGESSPTNWEPVLGTGEAHVLVTINTLTDALRAFRSGVEAAAGVAIVHEQHARLLEGAREHFGYADGFAQPAIAGVSEHKLLGGGVPEAGGGWRGLALGEFILGFEDEDSLVDPARALPSAPLEPLGRSGTYMVYRKLEQDVALFRNTLREAALLRGAGEDADHKHEDLLAAKVVGRWRNGTPLVSSPDAPVANFEPKDMRNNAFRYLDADGGGARCPLGAHIRRANPRDALGWKGLKSAALLAFRHRIIRRGMPYGPPLADDALANDGHDRGLVFVCFNASISRQFEGIQTQWINDGNAFHLGHDKDFLLGDPTTTNKMTIQGEPPGPPFFLAPQPAFVKTRGGEYLFVPGLRALRALADGDLSA